MLVSAAGTNAGNLSPGSESKLTDLAQPSRADIHTPATPESTRGSRMKTLQRFSDDHDWSKRKTYLLIDRGWLRTVRIGSRQYVTSESEAAFDAAAARGELAGE